MSGQTKRCPRCKKVKPTDAYHRNRSNADGFASECKFCKSRRASDSYYRNKAVSRLPEDQAEDKLSPQPR